MKKLPYSLLNDVFYLASIGFYPKQGYDKEERAVMVIIR